MAGQPGAGSGASGKEEDSWSGEDTEVYGDYCHSEVRVAMDNVLFYCVPDNGSPFGLQFAGVLSPSVALPDEINGGGLFQHRVHGKRGYPGEDKGNAHGPFLMSDNVIGPEALGIVTKSGRGNMMRKYTEVTRKEFDRRGPMPGEQMWTKDLTSEIQERREIRYLAQDITRVLDEASELGKRVILYGIGAGAWRLSMATLKYDIYNDRIIYVALESPYMGTYPSSRGVKGVLANYLCSFDIGDDSDPDDDITFIMAITKLTYVILCGSRDKALPDRSVILEVVDSGSPAIVTTSVTYGGNSVPDDAHALIDAMEKAHISVHSISVAGAERCRVLGPSRSTIVPRMHIIAMDIIKGA